MSESPKSGLTKLYYSIGEVAEMLGVNASLIRYWEKEFKTIKPKKNRKGNRLFTEKDIETLKYIHHLVKERGLTLEGARNVINQPDSTDLTNFQIIERLESLRRFLQQIRNEVK